MNSNKSIIRNRLAITIIVGLLLPTLSVSPSLADSSETPKGSTGNEGTSFVVRGTSLDATATADELVDIATVTAQAPELTGSEESLGWQTEFTLAVTRLQEEFSDQFADAGIDRASNTAWVSFAGPAPNDIREILADVAADVEVRQNIGWTEAGLAAYGTAVHYAVLDEEGVKDADTDVDTSIGAVTVTAEVEPGIDPIALELRLEEFLPNILRNVRTEAAQGAAARVSAAEVNAAAAAVSTTVEVVTTLNSGDETVSGGGSLSTCTAGFSVRTGRYSHGIITAHHCPKSQKYFGRSVLTWRASHAGSSGDVAFHSSSETSDARFYYQSGATRAITATANPVTGMSICKYGKTTLNTCDEVYKLNQCRGDYCGLAMVHRHRTDSGDSGGPWFWGNTGYGVHSGYKTYLLIERAMFTPVRKGATVLGLTVKLS